jgi:uncharacterized protein (TIGR03492 family)
MKLLCLSNGHGEDTIALRILQALQQRPDCPELAALPIVGEGHAYTAHGIPIAGPVKPMPSGGFVYMDGRQLLRDLQGGLLRLTQSQLQTVRDWAKAGAFMLAVGDIVPLLFAWCSGAPYAFVGTAKSEYYLRDEKGLLPRQSWFERLESWSGSVYLPWDRWLMQHPRCRAVFPRDRLTALVLKRWAIPTFDVGNPMMDGLDPVGLDFGLNAGVDADAGAGVDSRSLTFVLLPGSRPPEAYENWQLILQAVATLVPVFQWQKLVFLAAIAPTLDLHQLQQRAMAFGWRSSGTSASHPYQTLCQLHARLLLVPSGFNDCLHQADFAIAMSGTATEQFVGLGKPALILPGAGPQFTPAFAEAQTRLLGPSVTLVNSPTEIVSAVQALLHNPDRLQLIAANGRNRMGASGAADRMADCLMRLLNNERSIEYKKQL